MEYQVSIKTGDAPVIVSVSDEVITRQGDTVTERRYVSHEVFVPANVEHVVFADDATTYINITKVPEGQEGLRVYAETSAESSAA